MSIKIVKIIEPGIPFKERLMLKAVFDANIGDYLVLDTVQVKPGLVSNTIKHTYWFPDKNVKAGDIIVLYTKSGKNIQRQEVNGSTTWFFYWGKTDTLWKSQSGSAVLVRIGEWEYKLRP